MGKKIIFISNDFMIGGVETSFIALAKELLKRGYEIELHLLCKEKKIELDIPKQIKIVFVQHSIDKVFPKYVNDFRGSFKMGQYFHALNGLMYAIIRKLGFNYELGKIEKMFEDTSYTYGDICVVLKENNPGLYYAIARVKSKKIICFFHTEHFWVKMYKKIYEADYVQNIITVSKGNKDFLIHKDSKLENKIEVIHNIIDPEDIKRKSEEYNVEVNLKTRVVTVSRLSPERGIELLIESCAELKKTLKEEFEWLVIGQFQDQEYEKKCMNLVKKYKLENNCSFVGPIKNPYPYIKTADIMVVPSLREGFGMTIREAQILGVPVVATNTSGAKELIINGIDGFIAKKKNPKHVCNAIQNCINNKEIREHLHIVNFDEKDEIVRKFDSLLQ